MKPRHILLTDKLFTDSPDVGPTCLCSRCGLVIYHQVIRAWPDVSANHAQYYHEKTNVEIIDIETIPNGEGEYRYHPECLNI